MTISQVNTSSSNGNSGSTGCQNATQVFGPYNPEITVFANNNNATTGFSGFNSTICALTSNQRSVWYHITPVVGAQMNITTCNPATNFDTVISVFAGSSCSALNCTARSDDSCVYYRSSASSVSFVPTSNSYYVVVSGYGANVGTFELSFFQEATSTNSTNPPVAPITNSCSNPTIITPGNSYNGSNVNGTVLVNNPCNVAVNRSAVWYQFSVPSSMYLTLSTCNAATNFDTVILLFSGTCSNLICSAYNDDSGCSVGSSTTSTLNFLASGGTIYHFAVTGFSDVTGNFVLSFSQN